MQGIQRFIFSLLKKDAIATSIAPNRSSNEFKRSFSWGKTSEAVTGGNLARNAYIVKVLEFSFYAIANLLTGFLSQILPKRLYSIIHR